MLERISDTIGIELVDKEFPTEIENRRSIKLKEITHKKTTELWAEFLACKKHQKQNEEVPRTMEVPAVDEPRNFVEENTDKELDIKAKIEEKVNILSRELYESVTGRENRALKLKNRMIVKLNLRSGIIYSQFNVEEENKNSELEEITEPVNFVEVNNFEEKEVTEPQETMEEPKFEMPEPLRDDNIIIAPDREEMPVEESIVASENIESEEINDLDSIKITKNSQRIANMDIELPEYEAQEEYQKSKQEEVETEFPEENVIMSRIEIPKIQLDDVLIKNESFISPMPEFEQEENKFQIQEPEYEKELDNNIEEYISEENKLDESEQEEIISALKEMEVHIANEDIETEEPINYNKVEISEDNNDINMLLQQLQEWKENKNKVQKELEETYIEIENSEQEKNSAKERLSRAIEALKEDCKEDERKAEENRDIIKSNEATVNAILSAIDMN